MARDPAVGKTSAPVQLGHRAPTTSASRTFSPAPRSVSSPHPTAPADSVLPPPDLPRRRSSFDMDTVANLDRAAADRRGHSRSKSSTSTLPSIRSLKNRFQQSFTFGRKGPKIVKGDDAKRITVDHVRFSTATVGDGPRLKGFGGPAGAAPAARDMSRSASLPSKLHAARGHGDEDAPALPQLVFSVDSVDEFGVKQSVDQALASGYGSPTSPYPPSVRAATPALSTRQRDAASPSPRGGSPLLGRGSPLPGRPIVIAPRTTPSPMPLPSPFLRSATSPTSPKRARDSMTPQPWPRAEPGVPPLASPVTAPDTAPVPQRALSPTLSAANRRILNRVSQDFARRPDDPPLLSLRRRQAEERESVTRTLSRQGHRNSRILPGATLPAEVADLAMVRSKSALSLGATDDDGPSASRPTSRYLSPDAALEFAPVASEATRRDSQGRLRRRHSVSPVVTPTLPQSGTETSTDSPPVDAAKRDEPRDVSLGALLGRASTGLGFSSPLRPDERRPSKPFPPEFDEVPVRRVIVQQPSREDTARAAAPPVDAPAFLPVALGNVSRGDNLDCPDTPPSSARRNSSNPFVPPFLAPLTRAGSSSSASSSSASSYGAPSEAPPVLASLHTGARPPSLHDPFLPSTRELRKARSASSMASHGAQLRSSVVPPVPDSRDGSSDDDGDDGARRTSRSRRRKSEDYTAQRRATLAGESRRPTVVGEAQDGGRGEDERGSSPRITRQMRFDKSPEPDEAGEGELPHVADSSPVVQRLLAPEPSPLHASLARSPGDEHPFQLASYLNHSPATTPPAVATSARPSHLSAADLLVSPTSHARPAAPPAGSPPPPPTFTLRTPLPQQARLDSSSSALTLADMESEIVRMEAELARAWRSPSMAYDASSPAAHEDGFHPHPAVPFGGDDSGGQSPLVEGDASPAVSGDMITPRTARKWSIFEIEKAYERMKRLLGSSSSRPPVGAMGGFDPAPSDAGSFADESSTFPNGGFDAALEDALAQARRISRSMDEEGVEVLVDRSERAADDDDTLKIGFSPDSHSSSRRPSDNSFDSTHFEAKPLPGLPPPTPSIRSQPSSTSRERAPPLPRSAEHQQPAADGPDDAPLPEADLDRRALDAQNTVESASSVKGDEQNEQHEQGEHDGHGDGRTTPDHDRRPLEPSSPSPRQAAAHRSPDSPGRVPILGRKRTDSDASGMRRLVLPAASRLRAQNQRDSMLSLISVEDMLSQGGDSNEVFATAETDRGVFTTPPTSPTRRNPQTLSPGARSSPHRISFGSPLRSGVGRELQRRTAPEGTAAGEDGVGFESPAARMRRVSVQRLSEPPMSPPKRRGMVRATSGDASSWYPQTPSRRPDRPHRSEEPFTSSSTAKVHGDDEPASLNENVTIANIRNMDKLEIFFRFTAAKAEMDKAVLERDALLDALRETRLTLSDVRRQRDVFDDDLKRERLFAKKVKQHLGADPERHLDQLDALVEGRQTWEHRAQEALEALRGAEHELELLRDEVGKGRERQELLERENIAMGARLAAAEMQLDERAGRHQLAPVQHGGLSSLSTGRGSSSNSTASPNFGSLTASASSTAAPSSYATADAGFSPTLAAMSRSTSSATARPSGAVRGESAETVAPLPFGFATALRGPKDSQGSTSSSASSSYNHPAVGGFLSRSLAELAGSPIMGQVLRFRPGGGGSTTGADTDVEGELDGEPKSSYGSSLNVPSSPTRLGARAATPLEFVPSHNGQTTFRLPFSSSPALPAHNAEHDEAPADDAADEAERSFDSFTSSVDEPESDLDGNDEGALRKRDEAFLRDLTEEVEDVTLRVPQGQREGERDDQQEENPEERRGKRVTGR
ncbi:hypothetical protein JCM3775_005190 [Rhodotorula graminis]